MTIASKSELTYAAIVEGGLELALAEGIGNVSLGAVAKRLGISKSGVFSRIRSLEALQHAVLDDFDRRFVLEVFKPAMALPKGLPRLNGLVNGWIKWVCGKPKHSGCLYIAGSFEYDDTAGSLRDRLEHGVLKLRKALNTTVRQALEVGDLRPDTDVEQLGFEIYSLIVGLMHDARFLRDAKAPERMCNAYARLVSTYRSFTAVV